MVFWFNVSYNVHHMFFCKKQIFQEIISDIKIVRSINLNVYWDLNLLFATFSYFYEIVWDFLISCFCTLSLEPNFEPNLSLVVLVDSVVINATFVSQGNAPLSRTALGLAHEKTSIDSGAEQVLGRVPGYSAMVPRVLLQGIDRRYVIRRYPTNLTCASVRFAPFPAFVVAQNAHLFA